MNRRKLIWIVLAFFCMAWLPAGNLHAQEAPQEDAAAKQEKIKSLELLYISKELDLTPEEAQKFWPVYNKYSKEVNELIAERRKKAKELKNVPRTDKVAEEAMDKELGYEKKMLDIRTRYKQEFMKVLPARKVSNLYRAEREFRGMMIRQLKERKDNRMMRRHK
jgi:Spy/CpxP family protein refolding chaperone